MKRSKDVLRGKNDVDNPVRKLPKKKAKHEEVARSRRKMDTDEDSLPGAPFIFEENTVPCPKSIVLNLRIHAQQGDDATCSQLLKLLDQKDHSVAAESALCDVITRRDAEWETSAKTLMRAGVSGWHALHEVSKIGFNDGVAVLLAAQPALIRTELDFAKGYNGRTALMIASGGGHADVADTILSAITASRDAGEVVQYIGSTDLKSPALTYAARNGHSIVVKKLLAVRADIHQVGKMKDTALSCAARRGCGEVVRILLGRGANIDHANSRRDTPLILAASRNYHEATHILIAGRANVDHANLVGRTALMRATSAGCAAVVGNLISARANVNHTDLAGDTALICAARSGYAAIMENLIDSGANVDHANSTGDTAMTLAKSRSYGGAVEKLVAARAEVDQENPNDIVTPPEGPNGYSVIPNSPESEADSRSTILQSELPYTKSDEAWKNAMLASMEELKHEVAEGFRKIGEQCNDLIRRRTRLRRRPKAEGRAARPKARHEVQCSTEIPASASSSVLVGPGQSADKKTVPRGAQSFPPKRRQDASFASPKTEAS